MHSSVFTVETIELAATREAVVRGGRHLFPSVRHALRDVARIAVVGWGSQGPAQAANLRDTLASEGASTEVVVGLRTGSPSRAAAEAAGFRVEDIETAIGTSDLVLLLLSDAALAEQWPALLGAARPGTFIGLSHGFLEGWLDVTGAEWPDHVSVIAVCPKGMGPSVRRLYERGSGINCSVAVHRDRDGRAWDVAIAWALAIGAPYVFETDLMSEVRSDVFGERGVLLGAPHGIVESLYRRFLRQGDTPEAAFTRSAETLTGPVAKTISRCGIAGLVASFAAESRAEFDHAYASAYEPFLALLTEIYDEVASGNELTSVVMAGHRLPRWPMPTVEGTGMWRVGARVRSGRSSRSDQGETEIDPVTAGIFCAALVAQVDVLHERGHSWSEIANESVIEIVDSLIPYMHHKGIAGMIDGCSTTARLGARKWAPRFEAVMEQSVLPMLDQAGLAPPREPIARLRTHPIHSVLSTLGAYRPPIDLFDKADAL